MTNAKIACIDRNNFYFFGVYFSFQIIDINMKQKVAI